MEGIEVLGKVRLLDGLTDDELKRFGEVCGEESYKPGDIIIEENTEGRALYIVKRGTVSVSKVEGESETELIKLVVGEAFGEMSLIEDTKTSARVSAYNDVACLVIGREAFEKLLEGDTALSSKIYKNFTKILSERLRYTSQELFTWKPELNF